MSRLTMLVGLALVSAVATTEAAKPTPKAMPAAKPTMAKTQAPKGGAPKMSTVKAAGVKSPGPKVAGTHAKAPAAKAMKPAKADAHGAKVQVKTAKTQTRSASAEHKPKKGAESLTAASGGTTVPATTKTIDFTATPVGQKLETNSALRSKIEAKLEAAGYTGSVYEAAYGFKNVGQLNAATNQVQNQGYSFELLKVLMTGTYVDPQTQTVYRANRLPDGTVTLVSADLATNPTATRSLGQSKQAIAAGAEMPKVVVGGTSTATRTSPGAQPRRGSF